MAAMPTTCAHRTKRPRGSKADIGRGANYGAASESALSTGRCLPERLSHIARRVHPGVGNQSWVGRVQMVDGRAGLSCTRSRPEYYRVQRGRSWYKRGSSDRPARRDRKCFRGTHRAAAETVSGRGLLSDVETEPARPPPWECLGKRSHIR